MYSQFFKLQKNPFSQLIRQKNIYLPDSHQLVFNRLTECIAQSAGVVCLLGPAGVGKSTLITHAVKTTVQDGADIIHKDLSAFVDAQEWSEASQYDFSNIIAAVHEDSELSAGGCRKTVYVMDVTDNIDENALEKLLKTIVQQNAGNNSALLILAGRNSLEQPLNAAQQMLGGNLFQGIYYLDAFGDVEVGDYIVHRFCVVHYTGEPIFTDGAIRAVAALSCGIPRHINTICGMTLFQADKEHQLTVTEQKIADAAELCMLEDNNESFPLLGSMQKSVSPDPVSAFASASHLAQAPVAAQSHAGITRRSRNWLSFIRLGAVSAIAAIATVIAFQWFSAPQSAESIEKPVMDAQSETWVSATELHPGHHGALNEHQAADEFKAAGVTFNAVDADDNGNILDQSTELRAYLPDEAVQILLAKADVLAQNNHLTLPKENNAVTTYLQILDIQPDNIEAIQGIERIQQQFIQQAKQAMAQSRWKTAKSNLIKAKQIAAGDHAIDTLLADVRAQQVQAMKISLSQTVDQQELAAKKRANARYRLNEKGIDFDLTNFFLQAEQGKTDLIALFLDASIPVDAQDDSLGDTALMKAASYGHLDAVRLMLKRKADVNKQNRIGRTALMNAIVFEQYDIVFVLLNQAVDINISDRNGSNALMLAVQKNQPAIVEAILGKGVNIHARNVLGQNALSIALNSSNHDIISLLQSTHNMR
ncbi:Type II secretory pathway, component ExeA (predicted ATPase) [Nitrosomonas sp. Nm51]|uniref:ankyrin repeat domain-containing protein n=1 Tax=Nitrosomonas sp. Nm51 TaxID=133720 RepID=UPI0008CEEECC|nr:ankyrin repeat domain-containing protein [Nitrosomonas sp. Nm51]SER45768.1 Type II secretory pathway, component ExeA (predicted ATPase) [Nitrosomonas sp. Nm51]